MLKTEELRELESKNLDFLNKNIRIPFVFMIKRKNELLIRPVLDSEMIFGNGSIRNILAGNHFFHNSMGENCTNNIFLMKDDYEEIGDKCNFLQRIKIAYKVFCRLKNY